MKKKISLFFFAVLFTVMVFIPVRQARAVDIVFDPTNYVQTFLSALANKATQFATESMNNLVSLEWWQKQWEVRVLPLLKQVAVKQINDQTMDYVANGNDGQPFFVTDWNQYLIDGPADDAMVYVNSMLDNLASGRDSASGYSNSGYASYQTREAKKSINPREISLGINSVDGDVRENMFAGGDMRAFNEFLSPGNNPYSYSLLAQDVLSQETGRRRLIAEKEAVNGYIPKKNELGLITTPAAMFENAVNSASNLANDLLVNIIPDGTVWAAVQNFVVQASMKTFKEGFTITE